MPPKGTKQKTIIRIYGCNHEKTTRVQAYSSSITRVSDNGPCSKDSSIFKT